MKKFILLAFTVFIGTAAQASEECYQFDVSGHSRGLKELNIAIKKPLIGKAQATVSGQVGSRKVKSKFECMQGRRATMCVQKGGGGEFFIKRSKVSSITLAYVNLIIGAEGPDTAKAGTEIDEAFAILDVQNDEIENGEEELQPVAISGRQVRCDGEVEKNKAPAR